MNLEHTDLAAFGPPLSGVYDEVFRGGIDALRQHGFLGNEGDLLDVIESDKAAYRRFIRGCHYGWDLAQRKIGAYVIEYEKHRRQLRDEVRIDLRNRNKQEAEIKRALISCLESRQIVLRRLADAILYHMVKMQTWIVRHISAEYRIRDVDPITLAKTIETATDLNREERLNFHLVSDLTTVVHVGDLVQVRFSPGPPDWKLIELKEGKMNALLTGMLEKGQAGLKDQDTEEIGHQLGPKAVSQAKRMLRQQARERNFTQLISTDEGVDILHNVRTKFLPEVVHVKDYGETLRNLCLKVHSSGVEVAVIDDCLRLIVLDRRTYELLGGTGIAHILYHLQSGISDCNLRTDNMAELEKAKTIFPFFNIVQQNLYTMWPPPIFLWPMPKEMVFELLFGRIFVFAQLDFDKLFQAARGRAIDMRWATDEEILIPHVGRMIPGSPSAKGVRVKLLDRPELEGQTLLIGFFARILLEFMSPGQFLELVRRGFQKLG